MKKLYALILSVSIATIAFAQNPATDGFTNKAEATNSTINGLKQGKWLEYPGENDDDVSSDSTKPYYILNYYKDGKRVGISRWYVKRDGTLFMDELFTDGKQNGTANQYYTSGKVEAKVNFKDGKPDGAMTGYYEDGNIKSQATFTNGQRGKETDFPDNGNRASSNANKYRAQHTHDSLLMAQAAQRQANMMRVRHDSEEAAKQQQPANYADHLGRNEIFGFVDDNGTCLQARLVVVNTPTENANEISVQWQTKLPTDADWQAPERWIQFKGTDGKPYEIRLEAFINPDKTNQEDAYTFNFISAPMSDATQQKQHAKFGFRECNGTIWWCQKIYIDANKKVYLQLGNTRPQ